MTKKIQKKVVLNHTEPALKGKVHTVLVALILAFVFLVYFKSLTYPFVNWDDPVYVTKNLMIRSLSPDHLKEIFTNPYYGLYTPFLYLSFAIDYHFFQLNSTGYHVTNTLFHLANTGMVYALVLFLAKDWLIAAGVALIFGIHPVQVESVVWITERKNVLSGFFFFLSIFSYTFHSNQLAHKEKKWYLVSILFLIAAFLSKPSVIFVPLLIMVYDLAFGYFKQKSLWRYVPFFLITFVFVLLVPFTTLHGLEEHERAGYFDGKEPHVIVFTVMTAMLKYLELLFIPLRESVIYKTYYYSSLDHPHVFLSFVVLCFVGWLFYYFWKHDRKLVFWEALYFLPFLPIMHFYPIPWLMNDRYLYLNLIGGYVIVFVLLKRWSNKVVLAATIVAVTLFFTYLNFERQEIWASPEKLWLETQKVSEDYHIAPYHNLATEYLRDGKIDEAISLFKKSLSISGDPRTYSALGMAYFRKGDMDQAIHHLNEAIRRMPQQGHFYSNLGVIYQKQGKLDEAMKAFRQAVALQPWTPEIHNNLGALLLFIGEQEEAEKELLQTLEQDPNFSDALFNLGMLYHVRGQKDQSRQYLDRFIELNPNTPRAQQAQAILKEQR